MSLTPQGQLECLTGKQYEWFGYFCHALSAAVILAICLLSYSLTTLVPDPYKDLAAHPLFPGLALYVALNGPPLFGLGVF